MTNQERTLCTLILLALCLLGVRELEHAESKKNIKPKITVFVTGEVTRPGTVTLPAGSRRIHALEICGGVTSLADLSSLHPARQLEDGETLDISVKAEVITEIGAPPRPQFETPTALEPPMEKRFSVPSASATVLSKPPSKPKSKSGPKPESGARLNINTASRRQFESVPGIGPVLAQRIVEAREMRPNGSFDSIEDLAMIRGIKGKTLVRLRPHLELEGL